MNFYQNRDFGDENDYLYKKFENSKWYEKSGYGFWPWVVTKWFELIDDLSVNELKLVLIAVLNKYTLSQALIILKKSKLD